MGDGNLGICVDSDESCDAVKKMRVSVLEFEVHKTCS